MSETEKQESPIDRTIAISNDFKEAESGAGSMSFSGLCGFHTFFKGDEPGDVRYGMDTAFHAAIDKAFQDMWLDAEVIEEEHGEFTPETAARELEMQLEEFHHVSTNHGWARRLIDEFEDTLRNYEKQSEELSH